MKITFKLEKWNGNYTETSLTTVRDFEAEPHWTEEQIISKAWDVVRERKRLNGSLYEWHAVGVSVKEA